MIEPEEIVDFMKDNTMNDVNMQIQLHKIIWAPDKRGV
jgi:7-carboxy-7-deazaguanine synthase